MTNGSSAWAAEFWKNTIESRQAVSCTAPFCVSIRQSSSMRRCACVRSSGPYWRVGNVIDGSGGVGGGGASRGEVVYCEWRERAEGAARLRGFKELFQWIVIFLFGSWNPLWSHCITAWSHILVTRVANEYVVTCYTHCHVITVLSFPKKQPWIWIRTSFVITYFSVRSTLF